MTKVLGTLYSLPEGRQRKHTPRTRLLAKLAEVDAQLAALAALAAAEPPAAPGPARSIGTLSREVLLNDRRKYRNRLARAL